MKITELEIMENGVKSAPDSLKAEGNVTPREIKHIFDKLPELIAAKFNVLVSYVTDNVYSKEQTDLAISQRVVEIGAGDMTKAVYDKDNDGIVDEAKTAQSVGGADASTIATKTEVANAQNAAAAAQETADEAMETADSAMPKAGGTFTGDIRRSGANLAAYYRCAYVVDADNQPVENTLQIKFQRV